MEARVPIDEKLLEIERLSYQITSYGWLDLGKTVLRDD